MSTRRTIQTELNQLNDQAEIIVRASSFNGVNWLQTGLSVNLDDVPSFLTSVTSSYVRSAGTVAVGRTNVDLREISMLNAGGGGILQKDGAKLSP